MRSSPLKPGLILLFGVVLLPSLTGADTPPTTQTNAESPASPAAEEPIELDALPGFTRTTREGRNVYCRTEQSLGTRFKTEKCIDETRVRIYLAALKDQRQELEQLRNALNRIH